MILKLLLSWAVLWFVRTKICSTPAHHHNHGLLHDHSGKLSGSIFHINYETSWANDIIASWFNPTVRWKRELLEVWFSGGVLLMGIGQCMSLLLFTYILYRSVIALAMVNDASSNNFSEPIDQAFVLPGPDVEPQQLMVFWTCTLLVLLIHELGHAAAASMERLYIQGFGIFFVLIFPGAYVRVENSIQYLPARAQLRIYSAGVWHNFCFALLVFVAIELGPFLLPYTPFERLNIGLTVLEIQPFSPLYTVLPVGSVVTHINGIGLHSAGCFDSITQGYDLLLKSTFKLSSWQFETFARYLELPNQQTDKMDLAMGVGYCRDLNLLRNKFDERHADMLMMHYDALDCCRYTFSHQGSHADGYCFTADDISGNRPHQRVGGSHRQAFNASRIHSHAPFTALACLSPRDVMLHIGNSQHTPFSGPFAKDFDVDELEMLWRSPEGVLDAMRAHNDDSCLSDLDCNDEFSLSCIRPISSFPFALIKLDILDREDPIFVEYSPLALASSMTVSSYRLTSQYVKVILLDFPSLYKFVLSIPGLCHFFFWLCVQLSISVGILNMMPAKYLDGGLAFPQFARLYISRKWCKWVSDVVVGFGSALLALNILVFFLPMLKPTLNFLLSSVIS